MVVGFMAESLYVTKEEFGRVTDDVKQIKTAIIGEDMRGGIVRDMADAKKDIAEIKKDMKGGSQNAAGCDHLGKREKAMIYCSVIAASSVVFVELVKAAVH